jgi:hypothetical protein
MRETDHWPHNSKIEMDLTKTLQSLYTEREKLKSMIASFEGLRASPSDIGGNRRRSGRKSMGAGERQQVSERMKKYWERRKSQEEQ